MCPEGQGSAPSAPANYCTKCGGPLTPGSNFCQACGQPVGAPPQPVYQPYVAPKAFTVRDLGMGLGAYGALALIILMTVNVVILIWGIGTVYPHLDKHVYLFIITPFIINLAELGGTWFFLYYVVLAAAITASFLWMLWKSFRPLTKELEVKYPEKGHSPLYIIGTIFMAVMAFNIIFYLAVESGGVSPVTPDFGTRDLWQLLYGYAEASVWEEVVSRVLLIGIPLLFIDAALEFRNPQHKMKKAHQYVLGGGFTIGHKEALLLVFSSAMFGTAHVFSWDIVKILPAAVAGLAFGYLFLKLGLYAAILLHFGFDYLSIPLNVAPDSVTLSLVLGLLIIVWIIIGIPYLLLYASKGVGWMIGKRIWPDVPKVDPKPVYMQYYAPYPQYRPAAPPAYGPVPAPPPPGNASSPQYPGPRDPTAFGFRCRNCGNTEALYKDGTLTCTRCGTKN